MRTSEQRELWDFTYTCRECGLEETIRGYSREAQRICGKCNSIMPLEKKRVG